MCIGKIDKVTFGGAKKLNFSSTVEAEDVNKKIIIILKISPLSLSLVTHFSLTQSLILSSHFSSLFLSPRSLFWFLSLSSFSDWRGGLWLGNDSYGPILSLLSLFNSLSSSLLSFSHSDSLSLSFLSLSLLSFTLRFGSF